MKGRSQLQRKKALGGANERRHKMYFDGICTLEELKKVYRNLPLPTIPIGEAIL